MAGPERTVDVVRDAAVPLTGEGTVFDVLLDKVGDRRFVLLGEASHGTADMYALRAAMTRRLVEEKGFAAVAVEADWPDAYRAGCYARGTGHDQTADEALGGFERFPTWMWRNTEVVAFLDWLRQHNAGHDEDRRTGFYGLDLYSLFRSIDEVIRVLEDVDPDAAQRARARYACFDQFGDDSQAYGSAAAFGAGRSCEDDVVAQLDDLRRRGVDDLERTADPADADVRFYVEQNAALVQAAEEYYRSMFHGRVSSWNLRDRHMGRTLEALAAHLSDRRGEPAKVVVWAHNSHLGDARHTEMGGQGELNLGQLARERWGDDAVLVGFTTWTGTVTAASHWGGDAERKRVRPALPGSWEDVFHRTGIPRFAVDTEALGDDLGPPRIERAIGVIYRPQTERASHYFTSRIQKQFDLVYHLDETHALEPLERTQEWEIGEEAPETWPHAV